MLLWRESRELEDLVARLQELRAETIENMGEVRRHQDTLGERLKHPEADRQRMADELTELREGGNRCEGTLLTAFGGSVPLEGRGPRDLMT